MRISGAHLLWEWLVPACYENAKCPSYMRISTVVPTFYEKTACPPGMRIPIAHLLWEYYSAYVFWEYLVLPCYENTQCPSSENFTMPTCSENISCPPVVRTCRAHLLWEYYSAHALWEYPVPALNENTQVPTLYENTHGPPSREYFSAHLFWEYLVPTCYVRSRHGKQGQWAHPSPSACPGMPPSLLHSFLDHIVMIFFV
jgi:hypothetical protein